jgi:AcrR family transcriptional regulator
MTDDPRVRRTRRRLHDSLLALTVERGYDAVTVQDVLAHAETARSTFYAHFRDKDALLLSGFRDRGQPMFGAPPASGEDGDGGDPLAAYMRGLFTHVYGNRRLAQAFFGTDSAGLVAGHLRNMIVVAARRLLAVRACRDEGERELAVQFFAGAAFSLLTWWVQHDFPVEAEEMARSCHRFISGGLWQGSGAEEPSLQAA